MRVREKSGEGVLEIHLAAECGDYRRDITFMCGASCIAGKTTAQGGRFGENASFGLSDSLRNLGSRSARLSKTGTPPSPFEADSIDFSQMELQDGDPVPHRFSFSDRRKSNFRRCPCYLTYTNPRTHDAIRANLARSPLYSGQIKGVGPRYCRFYRG